MSTLGDPSPGTRARTALARVESHVDVCQLSETERHDRDETTFPQPVEDETLMGHDGIG